MLLDQRRLNILEAIESEGFVTLHDLVDKTGVSESTIRRDLEYLDRIGQIRRTRGGASYTGESLVGLEERGTHALAQKQAVARVGFDCRMTEGCWEISLYLGRTELVGGPRDGCHDPVDFCLNLQGLMQLLKEIRGMEWTVAHPQGETGPVTRSLLKVETDWEGHAVRLLFAGSPPQEVGPALRKFADGTCELL